MRIWDLPPGGLCRSHLLGEHRELHAVWTVLTRGKKGYSKHPETLRWKGRLRALYLRHDRLVLEMSRRGYAHHSPLERRMAIGASIQRTYVDSVARQKELLKKKGCSCRFDQKPSPRARAASRRR